MQLYPNISYEIKEKANSKTKKDDSLIIKTFSINGNFQNS